MSTYRFSVIIEKDQDGYYAFCPDLQGCYAQGQNYEEALASIKDAIQLHIDDRRDSGEKISGREFVSMTWLEMAV